jgi:hypothetical protein
MRRVRFTAIDRISWMPIVVVDLVDAPPAFHRDRQLVPGAEMGSTAAAVKEGAEWRVGNME